MKSKKWTYFGIGFVFWAGTCAALTFGKFTMNVLSAAVLFAVLSSVYFSIGFIKQHEEQFHSGVRK